MYDVNDYPSTVTSTRFAASFGVTWTPLGAAAALVIIIDAAAVSTAAAIPIRVCVFTDHLPVTAIAS